MEANAPLLIDANTISLTFETRSGDTLTPDTSWSDWQAVSANAIASPNGRYIQYRAVLSTTNLDVSPLVEQVTIAYAAIPLAVNLANFYAEQINNFVRVAWEMASEIDNRGFNLYRGTAPAAPDRQLNDLLIPSQSPGSPTGFVYTWNDHADLVTGTTKLLSTGALHATQNR